jgi:hypothetical protein
MNILLKDVRLAFATNLFTAAPFPGGNDPTPYYSCTLLMPPTHPQRKVLDKIMVELAEAKWGKKGAAVLKAAKATGKVFFRDGDTKPDYEGFEGMWFVSARSKVRPNYFDGRRNPISEADGLLYSGAYVNASLGLYAYTKGNNGLGAGLRGIQYYRKGDAFGGGAPAEMDDFEEITAPPDEEGDDGSDERDPLLG